ncbi:hypothetical protein LIER_39421 [Lithospermum erythrorhizon]|uniref:Uncharacterized protein n=1 Tax=Lithospermum erythrorhizon TaxID=34254 RepID=A0AAV3QEG9_LITER
MFDDIDLANSSLHSHLHYPVSEPLSWKQRLMICIDVARVHKSLMALRTRFLNLKSVAFFSMRALPPKLICSQPRPRSPQKMVYSIQIIYEMKRPGIRLLYFPLLQEATEDNHDIPEASDFTEIMIPEFLKSTNLKGRKKKSKRPVKCN